LYPNNTQTPEPGVTWTSRNTAGLDTDWISVAYGIGTFVAGGSDGIMTSSNKGVTWVVSSFNTWTGICFGGGLFVAAGGTGGNQIITSPEGMDWTNRPAP